MAGLTELGRRLTTEQTMLRMGLNKLVVEVQTLNTNITNYMTQLSQQNQQILSRLDVLNSAILILNETMLNVLVELRESEPLGVIEPVLGRSVTEVMNSFEPTSPWFSVDLFNNGPAKVYVAINDVARVWTEIESDKGKTYNFGRAKIRKIYYRCDTGQTATLDIEGQL